MHIRQVSRNLRHTGYNFGALALQLVHAHLHLGLVHAAFDCRHNARDGAGNLLHRFLVGGRLRAALMVQAVALFMIRPNRHCHRIRRCHPFCQTREHTLFDHPSTDSATVFINPPPMVVETAIAVTQNEPELTLAAAAGEQPGKERDGPARGVQFLGPRLADTDRGRLKDS